MDQTDIVIISVHPMAMPKLQIITNEQKIYVVDLSDLSSVYCFPRSQSDWENVSISAQGFNLTWGTRFEIHVHQAIDSAESVADIKRQA